MEMLLWTSIVERVPNSTVESHQPTLQPETGQAINAQRIADDMNGLIG